MAESSFSPLNNKSFEVYNLAETHLACSIFGRSLDMPIRDKETSTNVTLLAWNGVIIKICNFVESYT